RTPCKPAPGPKASDNPWAESLAGPCRPHDIFELSGYFWVLPARARGGPGRRTDSPPGPSVRLFELGVDDVLLLAVAARSAVRARARPTGGRRSAGAGRLVELGGHRVRFLLELLADFLDLGVVLLLDRRAPFLDERFDGVEVDARELLFVLGDLL